MWLDLTNIWLGFTSMSNVSFTVFDTYLSKFKCQLIYMHVNIHIYMHVNIHLAFIYTYLRK